MIVTNLHMRRQDQNGGFFIFKENLVKPREFWTDGYIIFSRALEPGKKLFKVREVVPIDWDSLAIKFYEMHPDNLKVSGWQLEMVKVLIEKQSAGEK